MGKTNVLVAVVAVIVIFVVVVVVVFHTNLFNGCFQRVNMKGPTFP